MAHTMKAPPWDADEQLAAFVELTARRVCARCKGRGGVVPMQAPTTRVSCSRCGGDGVEPLGEHIIEALGLRRAGAA